MLLIIVGGLLCISGLIDINLPRWADIKNEVTIFSGIVVVLWVLSGVLTAVDHFRFGGWIDDGPTGADQFASSYCHAVIEGNDDIAAEMVAPYLAKNFTDFSERLQAIRRELGNAKTQVTADALGTVDHVFFRALLPNLRQLEVAPSAVVAFVPIVSDVDVPVGSPIKVIQLLIAVPFGKFEVIESKVVETTRPQILT